MTEPHHPQALIDDQGTTVDELIAPLVIAARTHGLTTRWSCQGGDEGPFAFAYITFPDIKEALEFQLQTAHNLDYRLGENLALTIMRPLGPGEGPGGKVTWPPELTEFLIKGWASA